MSSTENSHNVTLQMVINIMHLEGPVAIHLPGQWPSPSGMPGSGTTFYGPDPNEAAVTQPGFVVSAGPSHAPGPNVSTLFENARTPISTESSVVDDGPLPSNGATETAETSAIQQACGWRGRVVSVGP
ncbi:hypothetical protein HGRIS_013302 [Hohenbuehelia grisea]|uniref:Uncharacterized protein n=1 Tax=Hohenbuehelia grisea TaxID=104357 RepID=A0ABR3IV83_9AGAR